jgi:hypothetical protein
MSIRPIDAQVQITKTTEISRTNSQESQKNMTFQQQQAVLTQQLSEGTLTKVYHHDKAHEAEIKDKQKEKRGQKEREKGKEGNGKEKSTLGKDLNGQIKTSRIDIKI